MLQPRRYLIDEFIFATRTAMSRGELFGLLIQTLGGLGFDQINFSIKYDPELDERFWGFGLISTYPRDWQGHYADMEYIRIDPVLRRATGLARPFWWRELGQLEALTAQQAAFLREGEAAGLYNGLAIPFRGPATQRAGVALATSGRRLLLPVNVSVVVAICNHFYDEYKRICGTIIRLPHLGPLSEQEREVLIRAANGRTDEEISMALGITRNTTNSHFKNIFLKLGVKTRAHAVAIALRKGFID